MCSIRPKIDTTEFIKRAIILHGDKYNYSETIYKNSYSQVIIKCIDHGAFSQISINHLQGKGCPQCGYSNQFSKESINWLTYIEKSQNIVLLTAVNKGEYVIPTTKFRADGYCKETNTVYEYLGDFYHGNLKKFNGNDINTKIGLTFNQLYNRTVNRRKIIENLGYNYIEIWEYDWKLAIKWVKKIQRLWRSRNLF